MGLVAKTPHPAPGDGLNSIGASSGIWMLRYARRESESVSPMYGRFCTYDVAQTWCLELGKLEIVTVWGGRKEMERRRLWDVFSEERTLIEYVHFVCPV